MRFHDLVFPGVVEQNWQMMPWEKIAMTGLLSKLKPKVALEIGVYYGGSLSLTSKFANHIYALDIDPAVSTRFVIPDNVTLIIGDSKTTVPESLNRIRQKGTPLTFVLIDADHSRDGVQRDIEAVLEYEPIEPMVILMHDSGNLPTRDGIKSANWGKNRFVDFIDLDFVPGQIIEHGIALGKTEVWGGFALAYLDPSKSSNHPRVVESARTSISILNSYLSL